jgi:hypothetical protein
LRICAASTRTTDINALKQKLEYFLPNPTKDAISLQFFDKKASRIQVFLTQ